MNRRKLNVRIEDVFLIMCWKYLRACSACIYNCMPLKILDVCFIYTMGHQRSFAFALAKIKNIIFRLLFLSSNHCCCNISYTKTLHQHPTTNVSWRVILFSFYFHSYMCIHKWSNSYILPRFSVGVFRMSSNRNVFAFAWLIWVCCNRVMYFVE